MKTIVRMLRSHRDLILNYFRARTCRVTELAYTTHLVSCPNRNSPTNSTDEAI